MEISLEQAIEIHARALKKRHKHRAPQAAREHAETLRYANDHDGYAVWLSVAEVADRLLREVPEPEDRAHILNRR